MLMMENIIMKSPVWGVGERPAWGTQAGQAGGAVPWPSPPAPRPPALSCSRFWTPSLPLT